MSNPSTKKTNTKKATRQQTPWLEDYQDCFTFQMLPVTQKFIERLAQDLITWSEDPENLTLEKFYLKKRIAGRTFYDWVDKYPLMKAAHQTAKENIGIRREEGAIMRKYDSATIAYTMPSYLNRWKDTAEWKAKLKAESENAAQPTVITRKIYTQYPSLKEDDASDNK